MSGPVWRFERERDAVCSECSRTIQGAYCEGEIAGAELRPLRTVCPDCYGRATRLIVHGELGRRVGGPGYAHR